MSRAAQGGVGDYVICRGWLGMLVSGATARARTVLAELSGSFKVSYIVEIPRLSYYLFTVFGCKKSNSVDGDYRVLGASP